MSPHRMDRMARWQCHCCPERLTHPNMPCLTGVSGDQMMHVGPRSSELRSDTPHSYHDQMFGCHRVVGVDRSVSHVCPCYCASVRLALRKHRAGSKYHTNKWGLTTWIHYKSLTKHLSHKNITCVRKGGSRFSAPLHAADREMDSTSRLVPLAELGLLSY
jgi:hypothetical protein